MFERLPLCAQLSAAFVAFVIEADNTAEQHVSHTTTSFGVRGEQGAIWLTSLAMWFNCVGPLADAGGELSVAELSAHARMTTNLDGMRRWGYITIDGIGRVSRRAGGAGRPRATVNSMLALTERGRAADSVWRPLPGSIEARWCERLGAAAIDRLRAALLAVAAVDSAALPDLLPILQPHLDVLPEPAPRDLDAASDAQLPLVSLLARVLLRFTLDCDRDARVPLPVWSDLVRVLDPVEPVAIRALPGLTGVSKEALAMMTGVLDKVGVLTIEPVPGRARGRQLRLTADRGVLAHSAGATRIAATFGTWETTYGADTITELQAALEPIVGDGTRRGSPLFDGLGPVPQTWRAHVTPPQLLPWYPLVLHRGGYPDGS